MSVPRPGGRAAILVVAGFLIFCTGCERKPAAPAGPPPERPAPPVGAIAALVRAVPIYLDEIGRCVPREHVAIKALVPGRITKIHVTDGASVKAGDPLFDIDPRPYEAALNQARAAETRERAALNLAQLQVGRYETLMSVNGMSRDAVDEKRNALAVAQAQVQSAVAAVQTAQLSLDYCFIRSPIDGITGHRLIDLGNVVKANGDDSLLMIERVDPLYVDFQVTEADFTRVQQKARDGALKVEVRIPELPDKPRMGDLTFVDNAVDQGTGTVKLRASLRNADHFLWPGRFVKARLILAVIADAVLVPSAAVQISAKGPFVYVVSKDNVAELRLVKAGQRHDDLVTILDGVKGGETVITIGHIAVFPGGKVRIVDPSASRL